MIHNSKWPRIIINTRSLMQAVNGVSHSLVDLLSLNGQLRSLVSIGLLVQPTGKGSRIIGTIYKRKYLENGLLKRMKLIYPLLSRMVALFNLKELRIRIVCE